MTANTLTAELTKGPHRFILRYEIGDESAALDELVDMVHRFHPAFDWLDAAVLSHQMGRNLARDLIKPLPIRKL